MHSMVAAKLRTDSHSSPAMAIQIPPPRKWSHKHIVLVALIGSLVVNAITAAIFISISPAHISFSIENPTTIGNKVDQDTKYHNFTLVVNNSSPHTAVHYGALSAEIWYTEEAWVPAVADRRSLDNGTTQPPGKEARIDLSAEYWKSEQGSTPAESSNEKRSPPPAPADDKDWSNCTVLVMGSVWFKSKGWISTRSYDVRAQCSQVNFNTRGTFPCNN